MVCIKENLLCDTHNERHLEFEIMDLESRREESSATGSVDCPEFTKLRR